MISHITSFRELDRFSRTFSTSHGPSYLICIPQTYRGISHTYKPLAVMLISHFSRQHRSDQGLSWLGGLAPRGIQMKGRLERSQDPVLTGGNKICHFSMEVTSWGNVSTWPKLLNQNGLDFENGGGYICYFYSFPFLKSDLNILSSTCYWCFGAGWMWESKHPRRNIFFLGPPRIWMFLFITPPII